MFDTINLRYSANYEVFISPDVYWVPYNFLGKSKYTNTEMKKLFAESKEEIEKKITFPYEIAQFLQVNSFTKKIDIFYSKIDNLEWELHRDGSDVLISHEGCCSTYAGLFIYLLKNNYEQLLVYALYLMINGDMPSTI